jgi:hypothetical protein
MNLDLRIPMGLLFTVGGVVLSLYGFLTGGNVLYQGSSNPDIHLIWGLVMLIFGTTTYVLGRRSTQRGRARAMRGINRHMSYGNAEGQVATRMSSKSWM